MVGTSFTFRTAVAVLWLVADVHGLPRNNLNSRAIITHEEKSDAALPPASWFAGRDAVADATIIIGPSVASTLLSGTIGLRSNQKKRSSRRTGFRIKPMKMLSRRPMAAKLAAALL
jgi:hypothetical protein